MFLKTVGLYFAELIKKKKKKVLIFTFYKVKNKKIISPPQKKKEKAKVSYKTFFNEKNFHF